MADTTQMFLSSATRHVLSGEKRSKKIVGILKISPAGNEVVRLSHCCEGQSEARRGSVSLTLPNIHVNANQSVAVIFTP